jgi:hypothetical protein
MTIKPNGYKPNYMVIWGGARYISHIAYKNRLCGVTYGRELVLEGFAQILILDFDKP